MWQRNGTESNPNGAIKNLNFNTMPTRNVNVMICGRKDPGYPSLNFHVKFETADELIQKVDKLIEEQTDFRKVDVYLDDDSIFTPEELALLEKEYFMFN